MAVDRPASQFRRLTALPATALVPVLDPTQAVAADRDALIAVPDLRRELGVTFVAIEANSYGTHPALTTENAFNVYVLQQLAALGGRVGAVPVAPAAPTAGQVDDVANTFSAEAVPGFAAYAQYEAFGFPGVAGTVPLTTANAYQSGSRIYLQGLTGPIAAGAVGLRVAASGSQPAGAYLTNATAFTGPAAPAPAPAGYQPAYTDTYPPAA